MGGSAIVKDNTFSDNVAYQRAGGITIINAGSATNIDGNIIENNSATGNDVGVGGILIQGNSAVVTVSNNRIRNNGGSSGYGGYAGGIKIRNNNANIVIDNNTISDNTSNSGIDIGGCGFGPVGYATITNNTIENNIGSGIHIDGDYSHTTTIHNNTVSNNSSHGISLGSGGVFIVEDNIVESNSGWGISLGSGVSGAGNIISGNTVRSNTGGIGVSDRKSTRLNSSHIPLSRMPSSA